MSVRHAAQDQPPRPARGRPCLGLRALIGSGERIAALVLPVLAIGDRAQCRLPEVFSVREATVAATDVRGRTRGGRRRVGVVGLALYVGSRLFAPAEEVELAARFDPEWAAYCDRVKVQWL